MTPATTIADAVALVVFHRINCLLVSEGAGHRHTTVLPFFEIFPQHRPVDGWQRGLNSVLVVQSFFAPPLHVPRTHWSPGSKVQRLPSSHGVESGTTVPPQTPMRHRSPAVQPLRSSHTWPSGMTVPTHAPPAIHRSLVLQALRSSQALPAGRRRAPGTHAFVVALQ